MISIVLFSPFFNNLYCMHCIYIVVVVVIEINFNSTQFSDLFNTHCPIKSVAIYTKHKKAG